MKVLVTGATGFIGAYLVGRLVKEGHEVICTVRKTSNLSRLRGISGLSLIECDLNNEKRVLSAVKDKAPEIVFHCAAIVKEKNESLLDEVNTGMTYNICAACLSAGVKRLVYVSSVAVVSGNKGCLSDDMPYLATNAYGRSKIKAEETVLNFREQGLKTAVIRPCMVYGVGEPHMLYRIFGMIKKRLIPLPDIPAMDSVLQLVAVENVVDALILAMEKDEALEGTFLIADKEIFTLKSLVTMLYDYLGAGKPRAIRGWLSNILLSMPLLRRVKLRFKNRIYDISRARRLLGYDPAVKTAEGLKCAADEWLRRNSVSK